MHQEVEERNSFKSGGHYCLSGVWCIGDWFVCTMFFASGKDCSEIQMWWEDLLFESITRYSIKLSIHIHNLMYQDMIIASGFPGSSFFPGIFTNLVRCRSMNPRLCKYCRMGFQDRKLEFDVTANLNSLHFYPWSCSYIPAFHASYDNLSKTLTIVG